ncbi:MAG: hypothetical protein EOP93_22235, partial [Lysobacteraceae bacterium]
MPHPTCTTPACPHDDRTHSPARSARRVATVPGARRRWHRCAVRQARDAARRRRARCCIAARTSP